MDRTLFLEEKTFWYKSPQIAPYTHSSPIMENPAGYITGILVMAEEIKGRTLPTAAPQGQPHSSPHKNTGRCMGRNTCPDILIPGM